MITIVLEASHLFRAGDKYQTQFFVMDVANFIKHKFFNNTDEIKVIVLHGSTKDEQAERYTAALERLKVKVVRMKPITSITGDGRFYYKPTWYLHKMMGNEIPKGSDVVLVGFHNERYLSFLTKYYKDYGLSVAAFATPSKKLGLMKIRENFSPYLKHSIDLDEHVSDIKAEFHHKSE